MFWTASIIVSRLFALLNAHIFIVVFDSLQIQIVKKFFCLYKEERKSSAQAHFYTETNERDVSTPLT